MAKKILFFVGGSYVSGMEIITLHLLKELIKKGFTVHCIISGWNDGVFKRRLEELNVSFEEVKLGWIYFRKPIWTLNTLIYYPSAFIKIRRSIRRFNPDIIHFCYYGVVLMLYPIIYSKCIFVLHESHAPSFKHRLFYWLLNKKISRFIAVSRHIKQVLERLGIPSNKINVIYNGIPNKIKHFATPVKEGRLVFGIIGQIVTWKGHLILVDAVDLLVKNGTKNFNVHIFGDDKGKFALEIKQKIKDKHLVDFFVWKGFINKQEIIYENIDVVVVPTITEEPCSITIIEGMMEGKLVIASNRGGNVELIRDNETGMIFNPQNSKNLAEKMYKVLIDEDYRTRIANKAKEFANLKLNCDHMVNNYINEYKLF